MGDASNRDLDTAAVLAEAPDGGDSLESVVRRGPRRARWERPADVKANRRNVSVLANNRIVFNIKGNDYRLVVAMRYDKQIMFIRFIGTHAEYDRIDATTV